MRFHFEDADHLGASPHCFSVAKALADGGEETSVELLWIGTLNCQNNTPVLRSCGRQSTIGWRFSSIPSYHGQVGYRTDSQSNLSLQIRNWSSNGSFTYWYTTCVYWREGIWAITPWKGPRISLVPCSHWPTRHLLMSIVGDRLSLMGFIGPTLRI